MTQSGACRFKWLAGDPKGMCRFQEYEEKTSMRKAALHNLGCKVNAYETEAMQQQLEEAGYKIVSFEEQADVYVINTCSVTNIADRKSRQMLHRAKKQNPDGVVVAVGCYVQAASESLKKDERVDLVIGNNRKKELVQILETYFAAREEHGTRKEGRGESDEGRSYVIDIGKTKEYEELNIKRDAGRTRAFIKIQDGCNQFCSYCIIPYTRGRVRSRRPEEILAEAASLVSQGYQEIVLTGIHLSSYGMDFPASEREDLLKLIVSLDQIPQLKRIRLGSLEPRIVTQEFVKTLAGLGTICPHFHLSLQSGCDETLLRMNRHYTTKQYEEGCQMLRHWFDRPAITTDVIVGFPKETEEEFQKTVAFLRRIHFFEMHIFRYSKRAGTRAAAMEGQLTESQKAVRSDVLLKLEQEMSREYRQGFLGEEKEVLMEEKIVIGQKEYLVGHTREYVKAAVLWKEGMKHLEGQMITGKLDALIGDDIVLMS